MNSLSIGFQAVGYGIIVSLLAVWRFVFTFGWPERGLLAYWVMLTVTMRRAGALSRNGFGLWLGLTLGAAVVKLAIF